MTEILLQCMTSLLKRAGVQASMRCLHLATDTGEGQSKYP
jgi:hypothetical protein